jgi:lipopolysaccharide/colanic/teichoic acid biosynthesis glycosyltransferase
MQSNFLHRCPQLDQEPRLILPNKNRALKRQRMIFLITLVINDMLMVAAAILMAWYVRIESGWIVYYSTIELTTILEMTLLGVISMSIIFSVQKLYSYNFLLEGTREYKSVMNSCSIGIIVLIIISFFDRDNLVSRGWLLISWVLAIVFVGSSRFLWRRFFLWLRKTKGWLMTPTIIVGVNEHSEVIADQLTSINAGINLVGFLDEFLPIGTKITQDKVVLGTPDKIHEVAEEHAVEQIIIISKALGWETYRNLMEQAGTSNGFDFNLSPGFYDLVNANIQVVNKGFVPLLRIEPAHISGLDLVLKTSLDLLLGTFLLILTAPALLFFVLSIWIACGRPIFIRYRVLGLGGKLFWTTKFFTAVQNEIDELMQADQQTYLAENKGDRTKCAIRKFLYRSNLDKLPQLLDVVRGKMSVVGPRIRCSLGNPNFSNPCYNLLTVKPGWVGSWATESGLSPDEEMRRNLFYIRNWTIWLDIQILFQVTKLIISSVLIKTRNNIKS